MKEVVFEITKEFFSSKEFKKVIEQDNEVSISVESGDWKIIENKVGGKGPTGSKGSTDNRYIILISVVRNESKHSPFSEIKKNYVITEMADNCKKFTKSSNNRKIGVLSSAIELVRKPGEDAFGYFEKLSSNNLFISLVYYSSLLTRIFSSYGYYEYDFNETDYEDAEALKINFKSIYEKMDKALIHDNLLNNYAVKGEK